MTPEIFIHEIMLPGLAHCGAVCGIPYRGEAEHLVLAICMQESGLEHRYQVLSKGRAGPARGWAQFERGGGVVGVMTHPATSDLAKRLCESLHVAWDSSAIWRAMEGNDLLAIGIARLLLWSDPAPLPTEQDAAWAYYERNWRPGKPRPKEWPGNWQAAGAALA